MHWSLCTQQEKPKPGTFYFTYNFLFWFLFLIYELLIIECILMGLLLQICWTWQKVVSADGDRGFQQFLDNVQYKSTGILRYERIFGHGFVSTGGIGMAILLFLIHICYVFCVGSFDVLSFD